MYDAGYKNIINVDFSKVVIKYMQDKYLDRGNNFKCKIRPEKFFIWPRIWFLLIFEFWAKIDFFVDVAMDVTEMDFRDAEFDVVIDKGTLDSILVRKISKISKTKNSPKFRKKSSKSQSSSPHRSFTC